MRTFFGIPCPDKLRERLSSLRRELEDIPSFKPVKSENFHMTLKFLGQTTEEEFRNLDSLIQRRLPTPGPIPLSLRGVGTFPDPGNPSVVWVGIQSQESLRQIHDTVENISVELGFDSETHSFTPHMTLGRIKGDFKNRSRLIEWLKKQGNEEFGEFTTKKVTLFESDLTPDGPVYSSIASWPI